MPKAAANNNTSILCKLIQHVRTVVQHGSDTATTSGSVADVSRGYLSTSWFSSLEQREPDETSYRQQILHAEAGGSVPIVALVWLPGRGTPIHDHAAWCVVDDGWQRSRWRGAAKSATAAAVDVATRPSNQCHRLLARLPAAYLAAGGLARPAGRAWDAVPDRRRVESKQVSQSHHQEVVRRCHHRMRMIRAE